MNRYSSATSRYHHSAASEPAGSRAATPLPPGTLNTDASNPFHDIVGSVASSYRPESGIDPFANPEEPNSASVNGSWGIRNGHEVKRYFHSRKLQEGEKPEKPWLVKKDSKEKWTTIIPALGILIGLAIGAFLVWEGLQTVVKNNYCQVLDETWGNGLNPNIWTKEVEIGGFGNGEFVQTTGGQENVFIENGNLVIKATLQDKNKMDHNNVIDLLHDKTCTSDRFENCVAATNMTKGNYSTVPPTKSGRINTKKGATIKYGRIEVTAKLPDGDWLWPAIWMMPVKPTYGEWPRSGEIDIMESRGNNWTYEQGGNDIVSSALHWGPDTAHDAWWKTNNKFKALHTNYAKGFNVYGLEWSEKYIFTYVNSRLLQVLYTDFKRPMFKRGGFDKTSANGTEVTKEWAQTGRSNTPFDQEFYLIINLAVGGTNGWFEDGRANKPWWNYDENAKRDFWNAREQWLPTWKQPQLEISRVHMQKQCNGNEDAL